MLKTQDSIIARLDQMTKTKISAKQVEAIFAAAYPFPPEAKVVDLTAFDENEPWLQQLTENNAKSLAHFTYVRDRAQTRRNAVAELFGKFNDQFPETANTPWAAWNAVCELADWRDGNGDADYSALLAGAQRKSTWPMPWLQP